MLDVEMLKNEIQSLKDKIKQFNASHNALDAFYGEFIKSAHHYRTQMLLAQEDLAEANRLKANYEAELDQALKNIDELREDYEEQLKQVKLELKEEGKEFSYAPIECVHA